MLHQQQQQQGASSPPPPPGFAAAMEVEQQEAGGGGGGGEDSERTSGGNRWPKQETIALLKIRSEMDAEFKDSSIKGPLWQQVSRFIFTYLHVFYPYMLFLCFYFYFPEFKIYGVFIS